MDTAFSYRRKNSLRLKGYDYSNEGMYFVTCVTHNRVNYFGEIRDSEVIMSEIGTIVLDEWLKSEKIRDELILGEFVIMPDHFHALVLIDNQVRAHSHAPQPGDTYKNKFGPQSKNLSALIRSFKASCTARIRKHVNTKFAWQRGYYDRVVRDQNELEHIEDYILNNPLNYTLSDFTKTVLTEVKN